MRRWMFGLSALLATTAPVVACSPGSDCDFGLCEGPAVGVDGGDVDSGDGGPVGPPPGCKPEEEPTTAPLCVVSTFGVFVAPGGTGDGTREKPLGSIQQAIDLALANKLPRVYVCKGEYREKLRITKAVSVFGGFTCAWAKSDENPRVGPDTAGYALQITGVTTIAPDAVIVADLEFVSAAAGNPGESSVALFVSDSSDVVFRRIKASAAAGQPGVNGGAFTTNLFSGSLLGIPALAGAGGGKKDCACPSYGTSAGASGGNGGTAVSVDGKVGGDGGAGPILPPPTPPTFDGHGGAGAINPAGSCVTGTFGAVATARKGGLGATGFGTATAAGWIPAGGGDGEAGNPGQGGGGGGGDALAGGGGGGGGGGCGGCGGAGGKAGQGGGGSIALLALSSTVRIEASEFSAGSAGKGGNASAGEGGGAGGGGAIGSGAGCSGREGGAGAGGGGGGGAAGGVSVGVAFRGKPPMVDGKPTSMAKTHPTVKALGTPGDRGVHGGAGPARIGGALSGLSGVDGLDGVAGDAFAIWQIP